MFPIVLNLGTHVLFKAANIEVNRCLGFLDRSSIDPCSDEILMNTAAFPAAVRCFHVKVKKRFDFLEELEPRYWKPTFATRSTGLVGFFMSTKGAQCGVFTSNV